MNQAEKLSNILPEEDIMEEIYEDKHWGPNTNAIFINIDRIKENNDVMRFQKTNDDVILEEIFHQRVPTLQIWARRYSYLTKNDSKDMFQEFTVHFMKAVRAYQKNKGHFNTFLYRTLLNCVRNIISNKKAKKRRPHSEDPDSINDFMLSLDFDYSAKNGSESTDAKRT